MAKEMMIIFVYDTQLLKTEEDDPASAILYFHPGWVSDQQKTALCGQIMGTTHFLKSVFSCPKVISLQSGKFSIREYGRYILAVGTDRNIADWVLEYRADTLSSLITFFHNDLEVMTDLYQSTENFSAKLYHMFETYLKILTYSSNLFSNIPKIQLPKSASNIFLEATQILQCCQEVEQVLGGTMLYHNKVVATQLSSNLTKRLVLTDPYRIKSPAEIVEVDYQLPLGVQLLHVYIEGPDYQDLLEDATRTRTVHQFLNKKLFNKKVAPIKEPVLTAMKRDQSLIFTTVPEEDPDAHSPVNIENNTITTKPLTRPKFLNLRNKTTDNTNNKHEERKSVPSTPFHGQTSICSTPMTDLNKILHQNVIAICTNPEKKTPLTPEIKFTEFIETDLENNLNSTSVNSLLSAVSEKSENEGLNQNKINNKTPYLTVNNNNVENLNLKNSSSLLELNKKEESLEVRYKKGKGVKIYKTIADPTFPVFRSDGSIISESLYDEFLNKHVNFLNNEANKSRKMYFEASRHELKRPFDYRDSDENATDVWKSIEDFDIIPRRSEKQKVDSPVRKSDSLKLKIDSLKSKPEEFEKEKSEEFRKKDDCFDDQKIKPKETRKALSLPLKSLSLDSESLYSPTVKSNKGVQLTPLMSKLSLLAMEERSSGFCSRDTTPSEYKDFRFTPTTANPSYSFLGGKNKESKFRRCVEEKVKKGVLFVCGQQDMVVGLLLEEDACGSPDVVKQLWEMCVESLGRLEKQLRQCLEMYPGGNGQTENGEPYSYLSIDQHWDTVQRGGPWGGMELGALTHLHRDFMDTKNLTEILLRDDESIIYGHHSGKTEVFYLQSASSNAGLPTPADPMGVVPLKAKRRLERDHAIILL